MITPRRRKRDTFLPWIQLLTDILCVNLMLKAAFWFRFGSHFFKNVLSASDYPIYHKSFLIVTLIVVVFIRSYGLYRPSRFLSFIDEVTRVCKAVAASTVVVMALTFFVRHFSFSRTFVVLSGVVLAFGIAAGRFLLGFAVMWIDQKRRGFRNVLVIGCDAPARNLVRSYQDHPRFGTRAVGFLDDTVPKEKLVEGVPVLGGLSSLRDILKANHSIHEVVLSVPGLSPEALLKVIYECEKEMVTFRWIADLFGLIAAKMNIAYVGGLPVLSFSDSPLAEWENRVLKRAMDAVISLVALAVLSPLLGLIALAVKLDSKGSVFFGQQRVGEDGKRFALYKFRTMRIGAEKETGPVWAGPNDPRCTRVGGFLRKTNLDELPQLWNVLTGDMSLVGPRPERPFFVSRFKEDIPRYMARHTIRSGITGWAQVNGLRGNTSIGERTKFDLYYIENWSLFLDLRIIFMTFWMTLTAKNRNAY